MFSGKPEGSKLRPVTGPEAPRRLRYSLWLVATGASLLVVLHGLNFDNVAPVRWFSYVMPWTLVAFLPAVCIAAKIHDYRLAILLIVPIVYITGCFLPDFLPKNNMMSAQPAIKVMTYNIWSENANMRAVAETIFTADPDVLLLQEVSSERFDELSVILNHGQGSSRFHASFSPDKLLAVMARFPIVPVATPDTQLYRVQKVSLEISTETFQVYNVHFLRRGSFSRRTDAVETLLLRRISQDKQPVILGGDFNTTAWTSMYRRLNSQLQNSHESAGFGFGFTFPTGVSMLPAGLHLPGLVRIDHIFFNNHFRASSSVVIKDSGGSDHFPLMATLVEKTSSSVK